MSHKIKLFRSKLTESVEDEIRNGDSYFKDKHDKYTPLNDKYFFHGTSTNAVGDSKSLNKNTYITRNHETAWWEGAYKVFGDQAESAIKKEHVGGNVVLYVIDASMIDLNLLITDEGYPDPRFDQAYIYTKPIPSNAIVDTISLPNENIYMDGKWIKRVNYPNPTKYYNDSDLSKNVGVKIHDGW